jgi:hypothetical protein
MLDGWRVVGDGCPLSTPVLLMRREELRRATRTGGPCLDGAGSASPLAALLPKHRAQNELDVPVGPRNGTLRHPQAAPAAAVRLGHSLDPLHNLLADSLPHRYASHNCHKAHHQRISKTSTRRADLITSSARFNLISMCLELRFY